MIRSGFAPSFAILAGAYSAAAVLLFVFWR